MRKILKFFTGVILVLFLFIVILIVTGVITDYKPDSEITIFHSEEPEVVPHWTEIDLLLWNIGYSGLNAEMDFFYDGGEMVRPGKEQVVENLENITGFLRKNDTVDFMLLQEVDKKSKRSHKINIVDSLGHEFSEYWSDFAVNYKVFFVPVPPADPLGMVHSGVLTLGKFKPESSVRYSFPGNYRFPKSLFMLDRCFLVNRYHLNNGKELLIVNSHNSAYDDGSLRKIQMDYLRKFLMKEYDIGNYVIVGADWNQSPPGFRPEYQDDIFDNENFSLIEDGFMPSGWRWVWDKEVPTNRRVQKPYDQGSTPTTIIDFYLVSPNVNVQYINTVDLRFSNSDHQPVLMKVELQTD